MRNKLSNFELGYTKGLSDKFNRFKFVPSKFLIRINKLKMREIIEITLKVIEKHIRKIINNKSL